MQNKHISIGTHITLDTKFKALNNIHPSVSNIQLYINPSINSKKYKKIKQKLKNKNISCYIHSCQKINICSDWDETSWHVIYLIYEIKMAYLIGAKGIVIHTGNKLTRDKVIALNNAYSFLLYIHNETLKESNVKIIIETSAGEGTEILYDLEDFIKFIEKFKNNNRIGVCLDTCHIFSAGYDIRNSKIFNQVLALFNKKVGLDKLILVHLNDSKYGLGKRKDRHDSLGYGNIGRKAIKYIVKKLKTLNIPIILETPEIHHFDEIIWLTKL
jgi:deoxyribonuclease IV